MSRPFASVLAAVVAACVVVRFMARLGNAQSPRCGEGWRYALFVDDAPYLMLGAQVHNSSIGRSSYRRCGRQWSTCT